MKGTLHLCPTPIGNLEDITFRAISTLKSVDLIAAEDTRHTLKLLNHFDIKTPLTSYHEHNKREKGNVLIDKLLQGEKVALVIGNEAVGVSEGLLAKSDARVKIPMVDETESLNAAVAAGIVMWVAAAGVKGACP